MEVMKCRLKVILLMLGAVSLSVADVSHLDHYELLDMKDVSHVVSKRGAPNTLGELKQLYVNALGRQFRLMLESDLKILTPDFRAYRVNSVGDKELIQADRQGHYTGYIYGESDSYVDAYIDDDGLLTASLSTEEETYTIEPAYRHFDIAETNSTLVAYRGSDVDKAFKKLQAQHK